jgi:hypothetical protein
VCFYCVYANRFKYLSAAGLARKMKQLTWPYKIKFEEFS